MGFSPRCIDARHEGRREESGESAAKMVSDVRLPPNLDLHQGVP